MDKQRFHVDNWEYNEKEDNFLCPNGRKVQFSHRSKRTDRYGFTREFKIYECENCSGCPLRDLCTKAKEGKNRRVYINEKWEHQKEYIRTKLSDETTEEIYRIRKIDTEPAFGFLKANLAFTRFSVRGKQQVKNELAFALIAGNLRKYTAPNEKITPRDGVASKNRFQAIIIIAWNLFYLLLLCPTLF